MIEIIQDGHPTLRLKAKVVPIKDIQTENIKHILKDMRKALNSQDDGVAIAAPQINSSLRIFMISGKVFSHRSSHDGTHELEKDITCINPVITKMSRDKKLVAEGCLSVRPFYGHVRRATRASIEAYDEDGKKFLLEGTGLLAQIFQHEIDHLDGILFIDKAKNVHESTPEEEFK